MPRCPHPVSGNDVSTFLIKCGRLNVRIKCVNTPKHLEWCLVLIKSVLFMVISSYLRGN